MVMVCELKGSGLYSDSMLQYICLYFAYVNEN